MGEDKRQLEDVNQTVELYTIQNSNWRLASELGVSFIDTSVKSGRKEFAPTWSMVLAYKDGRLSERAYETIYRARMARSQDANESAWEELYGLSRVAIGCYCTPGKFCHRHILADILENNLIERGVHVINMGEITKTR